MICRYNLKSIEEFEVEMVAVCTLMMKRLDELDAADDYQTMKYGRVAVMNIETNKQEYVYISLSNISLLLNKLCLS
jgi:hypothetical protein